MVDPLSYISFQLVLHDWCNKKSPGMCYPVCGIVHIKEPLLLIGKSSPCGGSGFYMHHPTDRIAHTKAFVTPVVEHWLERVIAQ